MPRNNRSTRLLDQVNVRQRVGTWGVRLLGLCMLAIGVLGAPTQTEAKLDPYYVLRGQSFGQFKPRILFAVDTSGSMSWLPSWPNTYAVRPDVEGEDPAKASRIHGARRAIHQVIDQTQDQADFSLMTFGHVRPPASAGQVPLKCTSGFWSGRFMWVPWTNMGGAWQSTINDFGSQGTWQLCGDNKQYAYLRHDNLGGFNMPNNQNGATPPAPLVKSVANEAAFKSSANFTRRVQFFPQFLGVRRNLDCADASDKSLVDRSFGDWGNTNAARGTGVCGRDFYYWPYVDGFPGYSQYSQYGSFSVNTRECSPYESCSTNYTRYHDAGTHRRTYSFNATLFAPFFSQAAIDSMAIPQSAKGPKDKTEATDLVLGLTSDTDEGGIEAHYGTPWASAIGDANWYVTKNGNVITPKGGTFPNSNAPFSHTTVSSYLSFMTTISTEDMCVPTAAVVISDGQPSPWSTEGSTTLYTRLANIRKVLDIKAYVVGFSEGFVNDATSWARLQGMACAASGANSVWNPCFGGTNYDWDTCKDPNDPANGCAWDAGDPDELAAALIEIVNGVIETPVPSGPQAVVNDFVPKQNPNEGVDPIQTTVSGWTETPSWKGHVVRAACTDVDDQDNLLEHCTNAGQAPDLNDQTEDFSDGGQTGCGLSRTWDAGECLQNKVWHKRRIYASDGQNTLYKISKNDGTSTAKFRNQLNGMGLLTPGQEQQEADDIAAFLLGKNAPDGWKLSGLSSSTPMVVRRIPEPDPNFAPSVGIRDPHCAGRTMGPGKEVPPQLVTFAEDAYDPDKQLVDGGGYAKHWEYEEAVLVGTDMGLLHAFQFDSGNELFAFLPRNLLPHVAELAANGPANYGQPAEMDQHKYGISSTLNHTWAWDKDADTWRHVAIFGFGKGSPEYVALDIAHMGQLANHNPVEVLWATWNVSDATWKSSYQKWLGESWSRPAITYAVPNGAASDLSEPPNAYVVFASGYPVKPGETYQGQTMFMVDAITGETQGEMAFFPAPANQSTIYDQVDDYALVSDPAIATQCQSSYWGEAQEAYMADPYGQLFRWDFGFAPNVAFPPPHEDDSKGKWSDNADIAAPLHRFRACQGKTQSCTVSSGGKGDVFTYSPAVVARDRINDPLDPNQVGWNEGSDDQYLVALNSGSPFDDVIDGGVKDNDFHSSIYLMADNHRAPDDNAGLDIPGIGGIAAAGVDPEYFRVALSQMQRERCVDYPDDTSSCDMKAFSRSTRPISAPRIDVTGLKQGNNVVAELFYITYTVYEPGENACDPKWYDDDAKEWVFDGGSTYTITLRLDVADGQAFDFNGSGYDLTGLDDGLSNGNNGLVAGAPKQLKGDECPDGYCGLQSPTPSKLPCDPNEYGATPNPATTVPMGWSELDGFTPLEN